LFPAATTKMLSAGTHTEKKWKGRGKKKRQVEEIVGNYMRLHVIVESSTHIVTSAGVGDWYESEQEFFTPLLSRVVNNHTVETICGDKNYMSKKHVEEAIKMGVTRCRFVPKRNYKAGDKKSEGWNENVAAYREGGGVSGEYFRERTQVESTFNMIKTRFTRELSAKLYVSLVNEALCLVICHNLRVLAEQSLLRETKPEFNFGGGTPAGSSRPRAEVGPTKPRARRKEVAAVSMREAQDCAIHLYYEEGQAWDGRRTKGAGCLIGLSPSGEPGLYHLYALTTRQVVKATRREVFLRIESPGGELIIPTAKADWLCDLAADDVALLPINLQLRFETPPFFPVRTLPGRGDLEEAGLGLGDEAFVAGRHFDADGRQRPPASVRAGRITSLGMAADEGGGGQSGDVVAVEFASFRPLPGAAFFVPDGGGGQWLLGINQGTTYSRLSVVDRADRRHPEGWCVRVADGQCVLLPAWRLKDLLDDDRLVQSHGLDCRLHRATHKPKTLPGLFTRTRFLAALAAVSRPEAGDDADGSA
jgi:hypothetical protein